MTRRTLRYSALLLISGGLFWMACGGGGGGGSTYTPPPASGPPANTIWVGQASSYGSPGANIFTPSSLTVSSGTTVTFVWMGNNHTVTTGTACAPDSVFDTGVHNAGYSTTHTFPTGTNHIYCTNHCASSNMMAAITVN